MQEEATTLGVVDVLTPRTLDEALRLKSETPGAVPIQGGERAPRLVAHQRPALARVGIDVHGGDAEAAGS